MHGGVQKSGVDAVAQGVRTGAFRQFHLGEHLVRAPPCRLESAEQRAVAVSPLGQRFVGTVESHFLSALRWPLRQLIAVHRLRARAQQPLRVYGPRRAPALVGARTHRQLTASGTVGRADLYLDDHTAALRNDQWRLEGELLEDLTADLVVGPDRQFHESGAGEQQGVVDPVIGEPGLGVHRQLYR